jgi:hypothetical protein
VLLPRLDQGSGQRILFLKQAVSAPKGTYIDARDASYLRLEKYSALIWTYLSHSEGS